MSTTWRLEHSWQVYRVMDPQGDAQKHCIPINDLAPHQLSEYCSCGPREGQELDIWLHCSYDGREEYERGRKLH